MPKHVEVSISIEISCADNLPVSRTAGGRVAGPGKVKLPKNAAATVQQPRSDHPGCGILPEHVGVSVPIEVPGSDDLPITRTAGSCTAGPGQSLSSHHGAVAIQQPCSDFPR